MSDRIDIRKTYKLYVGGAFPRSESGRSYLVSDAKGRFVANAAQASRKDVREAVVSARKAFPAWSGATAYNRGQVLYRVAEVMAGRRAQFVDEVAGGEGLPRKRAEADVTESVDRWVWYAGWADKLTQVLPETMTGATTLTRPSNDDCWGASVATTPVGSGSEKSKYGPATGLAFPNTWVSLSAHPAYQTQRSIDSVTTASARLRGSPSPLATSSTN